MRSLGYLWLVPSVVSEFFFEIGIADDMDMVWLQAEGAGAEADGFQDFLEFFS